MNPYDDEDNPGEAAREQARTPGNAHRRRVLNALLAAWDAHPDTPLGAVLDRAAVLGDERRLPWNIGAVSDAHMLAGLRALAKG